VTLRGGRHRIAAAGATALAAATALAGATALALGAAPATPASPAAPGSYTKALLLLDHPSGLYKFNRRVTDPGSPHYRDYRTVEDLIERFGADRRKSRRALDWLEARGFDARLDRTRTFITADATTPRARRSLTPADPTAARSARPGSIHRAVVPKALEGAVEAIALGDATESVASVPRAIGEPASRQTGDDYTSIREHTGTSAGCEEGRNAGAAGNPVAFTPNQYLTAYGHAALHERGIRGQGQRIAVVEIDGFAREDVETFGRCFGIDVPPISVIPVGIDKPLAQGLETTLYLEVLSATAPGARRIDVYEGGGAPIDLARTIGASLGRPGLHPDIVSISLGICEPQLAGSMAYWRAINNVFALSGAAGISTFVATGDTGAGGCTYTNSEGMRTALDVQAVSFPASSPFATAVGGTNLTLHPDNRIETEVTWNFGDAIAAEAGLGASGGGISILHDHHPFYQRGKRFAAAGPSRILPDVAALADGVPGYAIYCGPAHCGGGTRYPGWQAVDGTSAATPLTAGGIALANTLAKRRGKARVGFANPLIYRTGARRPNRHFHDVTVGDNDTGAQIEGSPGEFGCCPATRGYDLATGWGSIRFERFAERAAKGR
jgi:subtilase family serine protease